MTPFFMLKNNDLSLFTGLVIVDKQIIHAQHEIEQISSDSIPNQVKSFKVFPSR